MAGGPLTPIPQPKPWQAPPAPASYANKPTSVQTNAPYPTNRQPPLPTSAFPQTSPLTLPVQVVSQLLVNLVVRLNTLEIPKPLQTLLKTAQSNPLNPQVQRALLTLVLLNQRLAEFIKKNPTLQKVFQAIPTREQIREQVQEVLEHPAVQKAQEQTLKITVSLLKQGQAGLAAMSDSMLKETRQALSLSQESGREILQEFQEAFADVAQRLQQLSDGSSVTLPRITEAFHPLVQPLLPFIPGLGLVFPQPPETPTGEGGAAEKSSADFGLLLFIQTEHLGRFHIGIGQETQTRLIFEILSDEADPALLNTIENGIIRQLAGKGFPRPMIYQMPMNPGPVKSSVNPEPEKTALQLLQPNALFLVEIANQLAQWIHQLDEAHLPDQPASIEEAS